MPAVHSGRLQTYCSVRLRHEADLVPPKHHVLGSVDCSSYCRNGRDDLTKIRAKLDCAAGKLQSIFRKRFKDQMYLVSLCMTNVDTEFLVPGPQLSNNRLCLESVVHPIGPRKAQNLELVRGFGDNEFNLQFFRSFVVNGPDKGDQAWTYLAPYAQQEFLPSFLRYEHGPRACIPLRPEIESHVGAYGQARLLGENACTLGKRVWCRPCTGRKKHSCH